MAINSVRTALQLLSGAGELTRARAMEAAATLLELPGVGDTSTRVTQLAEELLQAATGNQQLVHDLVRTEFERQLTRLGLVRGSDLESAQRRIEALEAEVASLRADRSPVAASPTSATPATTSRRRPARSAVRSSAAEKVSAGAASGAAPAAQKNVARKPAATKSAATKSGAKKTAAKAAATRKSTTAKRSVQRGGGK
ncbi:hypothetical protein [Flexivirga oryzae]|uniref:Polyhydroxyalkanoate synthesis regulator phasin n=1 Tax=Flexivirga oryzae TaxID=1794944 RepID=A0A839N1L3_9MICO|nr:hypothetical protein [Flexivirga oryzae]MBB2891257.1 polyhydroxyalkanoate synthesis regulator phasin [Flexivirga oryzae]